jgi:hypothetical protein
MTYCFCQVRVHRPSEHLDSGHGAGDLNAICFFPESIHFLRVNAPSVAIPDVSCAAEGKPQAPWRAADRRLHSVPDRSRFCTLTHKGLRFID